jgi:ABC-type lipoprotein export system ATPase subunit
MEIPHGITLLKGYSGCGKSTLLRLIAGFLTPDSGRVTVPPNSVAPSRSFHKRSLGFVFQEINLLPDATVLRNVRLACALAGIEIGAEEKEKQIRWFRRLGLEALTERKVKTLSGGQKQRAAVARAIIKDPLVLCLDEPTSGLDDANTDILKCAILEFGRQKKTVVIASHDARLDTVADTIVDLQSLVPY